MARTLGLSLLAFFGSVALILYTAIASLGAATASSEDASGVTKGDIMKVQGCVCACAYVCVSVCVCVRARVRVRLRAFICGIIGSGSLASWFACPYRFRADMHARVHSLLTHPSTDSHCSLPVYCNHHPAQH